MNFIAGLLLLQLPSEKEAFIVLAWIIRSGQEQGEAGRQAWLVQG